MEVCSWGTSVWRRIDVLTVQVIMTIGGPGPRGGDDVNVSSGRMGDGKGESWGHGVGCWGLSAGL